jgi:hypothetical protein
MNLPAAVAVRGFVTADFFHAQSRRVHRTRNDCMIADTTKDVLVTHGPLPERWVDGTPGEHRWARAVDLLLFQTVLNMI